MELENIKINLIVSYIDIEKFYGSKQEKHN